VKRRKHVHYGRNRLSTVLDKFLIGPALLAAILCIPACSLPGPRSTPEQIGAIKRETVPAASEDAALSYLRAGDATLSRVIYIHGTPGSADGWADYLTNLVPGLEAVAVDRLGFGESGGRDGGVDSFEQQARAIAPLLVERAAPDHTARWPILVGYSLGGLIAARLAALHPDQVAGLIIVAGSLDPALEEPGFAQWLATSALVRFLLPQVLDNSMGELDAAKRETKLLAQELRKVTCPVIVIHGTTDELVPYANVAYLKKMLFNARSVRVVTLNGQGHFVPWEKPEEIRNAVREMAR